MNVSDPQKTALDIPGFPTRRLVQRGQEVERPWLARFSEIWSQPFSLGHLARCSGTWR